MRIRRSSVLVALATLCACSSLLVRAVPLHPQEACADSPPDRKPWRLGGPSGKPGFGDLQIRVVDGSGPVREAPRVQVTRSAPGGKVESLFDASPDREGRVFLADLTPGSAFVAVRIGEFRRSVLVQLSAGRTTEIDLLLPRGPRVEGEVRHAASGPAPGVAMSLQAVGTDSFMDTLTAKTDEQGRYRLGEVPCGRWLVSVRGGVFGPGERIRGAITVSGATPLSRNLLLGQVNLKGTVRDASTGRPVQGARITVRDFFIATVSTATGEYSFEDVPAGRHTLLVSADGLGERFLETGEVPEGGSKALTVDVALKPAATIVVTLRDAKDRPVSGEFWLGFQVPGGAPSTTTKLMADEKGECVYSRALPGRLRVDVRKDGYTAAPPQDVELKLGKNALRFVLVRAGGT